ncbi:hypothetical protein, partial [Pseudonocardia sp. NPDC049154]|uniref:hypothetical protein n=1 Tax=Pseudonocardia sp. NPDC049154 TaxID=3155501 RepID=UPI0033C0CBDE
EPLVVDPRLDPPDLGDLSCHSRLRMSWGNTCPSAAVWCCGRPRDRRRIRTPITGELIGGPMQWGRSALP